VALIRSARQRGVRVTAEVTPHHLTLTDQWVLGSLAEVETAEVSAESAKSGRRGRSKKSAQNHQGLGLRTWLDPRLLSPYDTRTRVSPPLRGEEDIEALLEGLRDGTIDAIATDHAPHATVDKECEYGFAACGISGLETALGLVLTLVHRGEMDLVNVAAKLTEGPAQVLGRAPSTLHPGARADLVVFDPDIPWTVDATTFASRGKNSPIHGQQLRGQVMLTMAGGVIVFRRDDFGKEVSSPRQASRLDGILTSEG
jgi:dihydroorotase